LIRQGIPGTAMPYFSIYTNRTLKELFQYLQDNIGIRQQIEQVPVAVTDTEQQEAAALYTQQCVSCHGNNGKVSEEGKKLRPPPRDLSKWGYHPAVTFKIISEGYPGTTMQGYGQIPERIRWALVKLVNSFYSENSNKKSK
jgi:mono/diheme cytochrome c family protein